MSFVLFLRILKSPELRPLDLIINSFRVLSHALCSVVKDLVQSYCEWAPE